MLIICILDLELCVIGVSIINTAISIKILVKLSNDDIFEILFYFEKLRILPLFLEY